MKRARKTAERPARASPKMSTPRARKPAAKPPRATKPPAKTPRATRPARRAAFGAPIDAFFPRQPAHLRAILEELRRLIEEVAPDAESSIKWGIPVYTVGGAMMCALGGDRAHVNLILPGPPGTYADPEGRLSGEGKTGRHLKLAALAELPREAVRTWLRTAAKLARAMR